MTWSHPEIFSSKYWQAGQALAKAEAVGVTVGCKAVATSSQVLPL